jgi:MFS family permease
VGYGVDRTFPTAGTHKTTTKRIAVVATLTAGIIAWFFLIEVSFVDIFSHFTNNTSWIYIAEALFFSFGALSAILGSWLCQKIERKRFLLSWTIFAVAVTASLAVFQGVIPLLIIGALLGISLGLGFPSSTALLADKTNAENRAKTSGLVILETFIMVSIGIALILLFNFGLTGIVLMCVLLRSTSFITIALDPCERTPIKEKSWRSILSYREFIFYILPWIMFNIAAGLAWWVIPIDYSYSLSSAYSLRFALAAIFGIASGHAADRYGRKSPIIIGLVILGISFGFLSFNISSLTVFFYLITSGAAWGSLMTIYLAVPGDLAFSGSKEKFYALIFVAPFVIYTSLNDSQKFFNVNSPVNGLAPILSIILFLSVILVSRAAETLPESNLRSRKMKDHLKKIEEVVEESKKT